MWGTGVRLSQQGIKFQSLTFHPAETSKNSDNLRFVKSFWPLISIVVNGEHRYFRYFWIFSNYFYYRLHDWALFILVCQWDRNPEISVSSRNNPEMSQRSLDLPMLVNFSIYIFPWDLLCTGWYRWWGFWAKKLIFHWLPLKSETFNKSQMSEPIDVPSGCIPGKRMRAVTNWYNSLPAYVNTLILFSCLFWVCKVSYGVSIN